MALANDPVARLQMASAVHAHTHAHAHTHYHLHQPDGTPATPGSSLHGAPPLPSHLSPYQPPSSVSSSLPYAGHALLERDALLQRELLARQAGADHLIAQQQHALHHDALMREQLLQRERLGVHIPPPPH